jgi:hypothetical protein
METPRTPVSARHAYTYDWNAAEHRRAVRWTTWARMRRPLFRVLRVVLYVFLALVALVAIGMALDGYTREPIELGVLALLVGALVLWSPGSPPRSSPGAPDEPTRTSTTPCTSGSTPSGYT